MKYSGEFRWAYLYPVCSAGSSAIAKVIGDRQRDWATATQQRLTKTKNVLNEMKGIKIMGLEDKMHHLLQNERIVETSQMKRRNWIMVWVNVVGTYYILLISRVMSTNSIKRIFLLLLLLQRPLLSLRSRHTYGARGLWM
jgi:hypothetical protein